MYLSNPFIRRHDCARQGGVVFRSLVTGIATFIFCLISLTGCTNLFYYPDHFIYRSPTELKYRYEFIDGIDAQSPALRGWLVHAASVKDGAAKGTVIHLHGNAQNVSAYLGSVKWFIDAGYDVLMIDYRGYGPSDGESEIDGMHSDLFRMFSAAEKRGKPIVLFGQSLGGAMALWLAAQEKVTPKVKAVVVEGPFVSYRSIARSRLATWWLSYPFQWPLSFLITNQYSPDKAIARSLATHPGDYPPVLLIHDKLDQIVPYNESSKLVSILTPNITEVVSKGMKHIFYSSDDACREPIQSFLIKSNP